MTDLLSVTDAHARLIALFAPLDIEEVPLAEAAGRVLARDVVATRAQPPFAASAMDGYAIQWADLVQGARLAVVGAAHAGARFEGQVEPGEAVRILTGAPVPEGADTVLIQEDVERDGDWILVRAASDRGPNIRAAAADFAAGACLAAPLRIGPAEMALLAAMNAGRVATRRRPVVALIPTGDELVTPGEEPGPDQIVCSTSYGLKAMLDAAGAEARILPIARDTARSLTAAFDLAEGADLIVTLGGASVGDLDLVRATALAEGLALEFHRIAMRPGKPLMAGRLRGTPLVGLPGNPVSAMICGHLFLVPAVAAMLGLPAGLPPLLRGRLDTALTPNGPRAHFMRARVTEEADGRRCHVLARQDSSLLTELAAANALVMRPPGDSARRIGDTVEFSWFS